MPILYQMVIVRNPLQLIYIDDSKNLPDLFAVALKITQFRHAVQAGI